MSESLQPHALQHTKLTWHSLSPRICSNSCPLSWWCHQASHHLLPPAPALNVSKHQGYKLFASGGQCTGAPTSALVLPMNIQGWFPLGMTNLISLLPKGTLKSLSPAPQFKSINSLVLSLLYGPTLTSLHDYWKNHSFDCKDLCLQSEYPL